MSATYAFSYSIRLMYSVSKLISLNTFILLLSKLEAKILRTVNRTEYIFLLRLI